MQSSPNLADGQRSNTHPRGTDLPPLNPLTVTLGITNASFVAQTIDWTLRTCTPSCAKRTPTRACRSCACCSAAAYMPELWTPFMDDASKVVLLQHETA